MQGKKTYQEKLFTSFRLSERIPENNFYRLLRETLDLEYLYRLTQSYYGKSGQKSVDPVVFFKLCLVVFLEITLYKVLLVLCKTPKKTK